MLALKVCIVLIVVITVSAKGHRKQSGRTLHTVPNRVIQPASSSWVKVVQNIWNNPKVQKGISYAKKGGMVAGGAAIIGAVGGTIDKVLNPSPAYPNITLIDVVSLPNITVVDLSEHSSSEPLVKGASVPVQLFAGLGTVAGVGFMVCVCVCIRIQIRRRGMRGSGQGFADH